MTVFPTTPVVWDEDVPFPLENSSYAAVSKAWGNWRLATNCAQNWLGFYGKVWDIALFGSFPTTDLYIEGLQITLMVVIIISFHLQGMTSAKVEWKLCHTQWYQPQRPERCYKHFLCLLRRLQISLMRTFSDAALKVSLLSLDVSFRVCICVLCTQICHISSGGSHDALAQGYSLSVTPCWQLPQCVCEREKGLSQFRLFLLLLSSRNVMCCLYFFFNKFRLNNIRVSRLFAFSTIEPLKHL